MKRSFILIAVFALHICKAAAQDVLPNSALQITGGYSKHGSGDMKGIGAGATYIHYVAKKIFLDYNLRTTINNGKEQITINNTTTGTTTDASILFTTAGLQLGVNAGYSFVRSRHVTMSISLGSFLRYQSASNGSDGYSLYGPAATGLPLILVGYDNRTPQQTFAVGGLLQLQVDVKISKQLYIGLVPGFQTDTNGDAITQLGLAVGRRF